MFAIAFLNNSEFSRYNNRAFAEKLPISWLAFLKPTGIDSNPYFHGSIYQKGNHCISKYY